MPNKLPVLGFFVITNPDFAPSASRLRKLVVFQEGDRLHIPSSERAWLEQKVLEGFSYLHHKTHQGDLCAVEIRQGTKEDAELYSQQQQQTPTLRRRRRRSNAKAL